MRFDDSASLDTSQVSDRRGMGPAAVGGGGVIGLIVLLVTVFAGGDPSAITPPTFEGAGTRSDLAAECRTGADANARQDCRIVGVVNSVQQYWKSTQPGYTEADTVFFSSGTNSACGAATSDVGPFYCPGDQTIYIDLSFFDDLRSRFGASGGPFAEAYVIAHEYGHHMENQLGILGRAQSSSSGATGGSVRTELMADCLAGMWARGATATGFIVELTEQDIADGLDAAAAVGDDRIQQRAQGRVDKESWTHGSSEQRSRWFKKGFAATSLESCNTFSANPL